jgi:hypothetical protein
MKQCKCGSKLKPVKIGTNDLGVWLNCPACKTTMLTKDDDEKVNTTTSNATDKLRRKAG